MNGLFVGIDIAKDKLDVHVRPRGESLAIATDEAGLRELVKRFQAQPPALIVLEATGGYEVAVAATLASAGLPVAVVNPRREVAMTDHRQPGASIFICALTRLLEPRRSAFLYRIQQVHLRVSELNPNSLSA